MLECAERLKRKLSAGEPTFGLWVTLESATVSEIAAALGLDWVVIDTEHGHLDFREVLDHVRVLTHTATAPLVRIPEISQGTIKRVLDIGAAGVVVPQVNTAEDVARAVSFAKYPPEGVRGVGGERATGWGMTLESATRRANGRTLVVPIIETVKAGEDLDSILAVPGVDAAFLGPADFSASAGYLGSWEGPGVAQRLLDFKDRIRAAGLACGILTTDPGNARMRLEQGFGMLGLGPDTGMLIRSLRTALAAVGKEEAK